MAGTDGAGRRRRARGAACGGPSRRRGGRARPSRPETESWEGVDRELFDHLRGLRRELADTRGEPPHIIFNDATLRDLARRRPTSLNAFAGVHGVGERKLRDLGATFVEHIRQWCTSH